ncbi:D-amino acid dehydrogenase small subunit [Variibacter gotjawalensis]|uniref:D-amino acid dehydrogenase n=1 Tax=Variibacter gotjawalensis TaxID=1333996 RepID=A0A0S3PSQ5_9BRAD|nr:D-amino acid dehydrogenase [Variibacter gotjawalensis]NIK49221.1 D-amino-acid dehydrogenase [Variibacter gotjawalensis]RZS51074.1 D-amino acid dehydrogenase small subunit [Variibacter gotjawalensis]BAT58908.1 D-amino acid dehydrogenase small subunit [Variibacter gotjawalensis]
MHVVILGAGVIGVTSAYYLARAGHQVTVIDRQSGPALETSFANAGEVSPGYASPWAAPGIPQKAAKWLFMRHAPLIIQPLLNFATIEWCIETLRNCTSARYKVNKSRMVRLAEYSRDQLIALRQTTGIQYDHRTQGTLQLFRTQHQLDGIAKDVEVLKKDGVPFEVLDRAGCVAAEPGLAATRDRFVGGLRLPNDETGDCFMFTNALAKLAEAEGVQFRFRTAVRGFRMQGGKVALVETDAGDIEADIFVAALGSFTPQLVKPLGLKIPVYPVKGYSITVPIVDETRAPQSTIMDETYKVAITRLGDRIRVGGMAEIAGFDTTLHEQRRATLVHSVEDLFGGAGDQKRATFWTGLRPMTPDGTPVVGATRYPNLYLATGHGTLGWTMACGTGRVLSDMISGTRPEIETADLSLSRYA